MDAFASQLIDVLSKYAGSFATMTYVEAEHLLNEWRSSFRTVKLNDEEKVRWVELECKPIQFVDNENGGGIDCSVRAFSNGRELSYSMYIPREGVVEISSGVYDHNVSGLPSRIGVLARDPAVSCVWLG